ncbi:hypothetical protein AcV5_002550 [Taiwanofungus camphoratus]|nr:hypothetical protein AcV5_002550 [Antrodia cinnamomea]
MQPESSKTAHLELPPIAVLETAPVLATPAPASQRKRLAPEGYKLLTDFFTINPTPTASQRRELLEQLHGIPGCEHYTQQALASYFAVRRKNDKGRNAVPESTSAGGRKASTVTSSHDILYPTLRSDVIQKLEILVSENPLPNEDVVKIWARRLDADTNDIFTWIELRRIASQRAAGRVIPKEEHIQSSEVPHLPTPESSSSPEPLSEMAYDSECTSPLLQEDTLEADRKSTLPDEPLRSLRQALQHALSEPHHESLTPVKTFEEFCRLYEPHEKRLMELVGKINQGAFTQWGLDSFILSKPSLL